VMGSYLEDTFEAYRDEYEYLAMLTIAVNAQEADSLLAFYSSSGSLSHLVVQRTKDRLLHPSYIHLLRLSTYQPFLYLIQLAC
jgi:hypothetical protein